MESPFYPRSNIVTGRRPRWAPVLPDPHPGSIHPQTTGGGGGRVGGGGGGSSSSELARVRSKASKRRRG